MTQQPEQQVGPGADRIAQPDPAVMRRECDELVDGRVQPAQRILTLGSHAWLGQRDFPGGAGEQHDAELMLELFDGCRQRGLGDEQPLGGAAAVQFLAEDGEVPATAA